LTSDVVPFSRTGKISDLTEILQQCQQGDFSWGMAGLFNLFASFKAVGEPAPCILKE
jgi:hypothetical protein